MKCKIDEWIGDLNTLSLFAQIQPHASYAAYIVMVSFWWDLFRVCSCSADLLLSFDHFTRSVFLSDLLGQICIVPGDAERKLLSLPKQLGGFGVFHPSIIVSQQYSCSVEVNASLVGSSICMVTV